MCRIKCSYCECFLFEAENECRKCGKRMDGHKELWLPFDEDIFSYCGACVPDKGSKFLESWTIGPWGRKNYELFNALKYREALKYGWLYECKKCRELWFLYESRRKIRHIAQEKVGMLFEWNEGEEKITDEAKKILINIKPTPPDKHRTKFFENIYIPCECEFNDGTKHDKCLIWIKSFPSFIEDGYAGDRDMFRVRSINSVKTIKPSKYSYSYDVRLAIANREEISNGWAPVTIKTPSNKLFTINSCSNFGLIAGINGSEFKVVSKNDYDKCERLTIDKNEEEYFWKDTKFISADFDVVFSDACFVPSPAVKYLRAIIKDNNNKKQSLVDFAAMLELDERTLIAAANRRYPLKKWQEIEILNS
ncbi:MAG: hypothetical protein HQL29_01930 [Candidatus Omnitrophica bacterium]|nr:hypothetical protein [Candidatus Omnitrophota bacterium]